MDQFRKCVGQSSRPDVVYRLNRIIQESRRASIWPAPDVQVHACVYDLLTPSLHFCIVPLDGSEIEFCGSRAGDLRCRSTPTQTNEKTGTTQHDNLRARINRSRFFFGERGANV